MSWLQTSISYLKGVGPERAKLLEQEVGIRDFEDLLLFLPFRYIDKTRPVRIAEVPPQFSESVLFRGKIVNVSLTGKPRQKRLVAKFSDGTGTIDLIWFKGAQWIQKTIKAGVPCQVFAKPNWYLGQMSLPHPEVEYAWTQEGAFEPVYSSTEKLQAKGFGNRAFGKLVRQVLEDPQFHFPEILSVEQRQELGLWDMASSLRAVHFPRTANEAPTGRVNVVFRELFELQVYLVRQKEWVATRLKGFAFPEVGGLFKAFYEKALPFELTDAQKRVVREIRKDCRGEIQMNRLLQGDVGSGKTIVAVLSMLMAVDNGFQACLMAPTEILAQQHYTSISELLEPIGVQVELLTGSTKKKERTPIFERLAEGSLSVIIGTHALLEPAVVFQNLGLVVIDEQHRFGVAQRSRLWKKNTKPPHVLVMTATPIPRTLAMTVYGDLDVSVIDELPPRRKPITTVHRQENHRSRVFGFMASEIAKGRQVYVVFPLIQESEAMDYHNLMEGYESISRRFPMPDYQISIVHGQLKPAQKEYEMNRFVKGETHIMVATTVIEVGVNVPNASVMIVESAERFGLAQLHQLRGRVGRGSDKSYCILMTGEKLSQDARHRMEVLTRTQDGFEVAEEDLKLRGPGDMMGTQQSGVMQLKNADLKKDQAILEKAREVAKAVLLADSDLSSEKNSNLKHRITEKYKDKTIWGKIS